jgi:polysaccharide deacetylase 2 family uncharacterized protein YibQ
LRNRASPNALAPSTVSAARWFLAGLIAIVLLALAGGCARESLGTKELRGVTAEIVSASERVTGRKSEVTIRPEFRASWIFWRNQLVADDIYLSLENASQADALRQALAQIAQRHKLSLAETSSAGAIRVDFAFRGNRTHTIHIVVPLTARSRAPAGPAAANPQLAIILDDLGHDRSAADSLLALPFPLTVSVLPHLSFSTEIAEEVYRRGDEVLLHLPMESQSGGAKPEAVQLRVGMDRDDVESILAGMLETVPHATGVNNHQGSRATADPALMDALMPALRRRGLFFIDSRTTAATVAYDSAERAGVPAASRKVFLDDTPSREAILGQLELAARDARRDGFAIAIGHPHPATIAALAEGLPRLEAGGIRLVFASDLVH